MIFRDAGRLSHLSDEAAAPRKTRTAEKSAPYWGLTGFAIAGMGSKTDQALNAVRDICSGMCVRIRLKLKTR
jgi:hypothetical protein